MNYMRKLAGKVRNRLVDYSRLDSIQESLGRIESALNAGQPASNPRDHEFKVYSQWGEDGIIDHLVMRIPGIARSFIEFGVEDYTEANTLFLLKHRYWRGLVIDGSPANVASIRRSTAYWRHDLRAEAAFITRENINELIMRQGFQGEIGLLSVDIDGNDYWVWEAIDCVRPGIVVAEYNSLFGPRATVSIPYQSDFVRSQADATNMYYGASIAALNHLANRKGYSLVAGNSAGNNAFFVRDEFLGALQKLAPEQAYVAAGFREAHGPDGEMIHLSFTERQAAIATCPLVDVKTGQPTCLRDLL